jgi:hypothetical protein
MRKDKKRDRRHFEHLKAEGKRRGYDEKTATVKAAQEVREMRRREGRAKISEVGERPR